MNEIHEIMENEIYNEILKQQIKYIDIEAGNLKTYNNMLPMISKILSDKQLERFDYLIRKEIHKQRDFDAEQYIQTQMRNALKRKNVIYWRKQKRRLMGLGN